MSKKPSSSLSFAHRDPDEVAEMFSQRFSPVVIKAHGRDGFVDMTGTYGRLPGVDFNRTAFELGFTIFPQEKDDSYFFLFPVEGAVSVGSGHRVIEANTRFASASYGLTMDAVEFASGLKKVALSVERTLVEDRLARLIDSQMKSCVAFEPVVDQAAGRIPSLVSYVSFLSSSEFGRMIDVTPVASRQMANTVVDLLLEVWPHNFSSLLDRPAALVAPRHVKRAIDYIHAHPHEDLSVEALADICGVSMRALQYGFRNFLGLSIGQYERRVRLDGARRSMVQNPSLTVAEIARIWNFSNIYRFSIQFKHAFGVLPREFKQTHRPR